MHHKALATYFFPEQPDRRVENYSIARTARVGPATGFEQWLKIEMEAAARTYPACVKSIQASVESFDGDFFHWELCAWDRFSIHGPDLRDRNPLMRGHCRSLFSPYVHWIHHSCFPNARFHQIFDQDGCVQLAVVAEEDILKGDEITVFFSEEKDPVQRREVIQTRFSSLRSLLRSRCRCAPCARGFKDAASWQARKTQYQVLRGLPGGQRTRSLSDG